MAGEINISLMAAEMQRYVVQNRDVVKADFARALNTPIDSYCRKLTKIKGTYQGLNSLMTHVVQGFAPTWTPLGEFHVKDKELKNYHQKVNFQFTPAAVLGTFLADWYEENKKPTDKEISKKIMDWLMTQITDDVSYLSMVGEFNSASSVGYFGFSLPGWKRIITDALANTDHPVFHIPMEAFTDENVIDGFKTFEKQLPKLLKGKIKAIHCSGNVKEMYEDAYFERYGVNPSFKDPDKTKSPIGKRVIIGHDDLADDVMWATVDGNMLNLLDINNPATITDIQVQDYLVKVFGEFWKGWDLLINEAVCVADFSGGAVRGLNNSELTKLYYPHEIAPAAPTITSVTVTPGTTSIEAGETAQFTSAIAPSTSPQNVVWSIEAAEGLSVNQSGLVTTTGATPAGEYTVTAKSVVNESVLGTATLTVTTE